MLRRRFIGHVWGAPKSTDERGSRSIAGEARKTPPPLPCVTERTRVRDTSSVASAHRAAAWRTKVAILSSPNLRLIQALQPGLSRTSDLRRPVVV
jgi:hypothetical protein